MLYALVVTILLYLINLSIFVEISTGILITICILPVTFLPILFKLRQLNKEIKSSNRLYNTIPVTNEC